MTVDEMELVEQLGRDVAPLSLEVSERAKVLLRAAIAVDETDGASRRSRSGRRRWRTLAGTGSLVAAAAVAGVATLVTGGTPGGVPTKGTPRSLVDRLASASIAEPAPQGRYVVLSEIDTESGHPGQFRRTTVVDTQTGATTTYQQAYSSAGVPVPNSAYAPTASASESTARSATATATTATPTPAKAAASAQRAAAAAAAASAASASSASAGPPTVLTTGPDPTSTEAWFAALPTDPVALRAKLLALATEPHTGIQPALVQGFTSEDYVYQEAGLLLWSPLTSPALRSALYQVLAGTSGYTVTQGTDPAGRPATVMTRTYTANAETDTTYENPATGAVLAQVWKTGGDVNTAVYLPVTASNTPPPDPYSS